MRFISWNVNGLRAIHRKGNWEWFFEASPDIFCLQEIKAEEDQLPPEVANPNGYHAYFNSSRARKGYSGVALYSKEEPLNVDHDALPAHLNKEGRLIQAEYKDFYFFNGYFPNGGRGQERLDYKLDFFDEFLKKAQKLRKKKPIIFCGDVNVAHEEIDLARPKENSDRTGFLPEERAWVDEVVAAGYVDTFRHFYPEKPSMYSYWDMVTRARERNVGWRIDYFFVSNELVPKLKRAEILTDIYGSDHCPVMLELK